MKKIAALLTILILMLSLAACASPEVAPDPQPEPEPEPTDSQPDALQKILDSGQLVVATSPDYAPNEFIDPSKTGQEQYVGADISFAYYLAEQLGVELVIEAMDFDSIQAAVSLGSVDLGISGFSWLAERAEVMDLSDPYFSNDYGQGLIVAEGLESEFNSAESFSGKKVAFQNGSLQQMLATAQLPEDTTFETVTNIGDAVLMLQTGKVDAVAVSGENGAALVLANTGIAMCDFMFEMDDEGYVVMMQKGQTALVEKINSIIATVVAEDLYSQWMSEAMDLQAELGIE